jgi:hypothetical protein
MLFGVIGQSGYITARNQVPAVGRGEFEIAREAYKTAFAKTFAGAAEDAAPHVYGATRHIDSILRAGGRTLLGHSQGRLGIDLRQSTVTCR